jgi:hypothetical protein
MTELPKNLLVGADRRLYIKKPVGPETAPLFEATLLANDNDLPADRVSGPALELKNFPKISMHEMIFVHAYFAAIFESFKSEAIVLFHREPGDTSYTIVVPESYSATAASLTYDHSQPKFCKTCRICSTQEIDVCPRCGTNTMAKTRIYGTAHSHGSMSAFHSGTDDAHEKNQTGFHITFGNVNQGLFSICPSFVVALNGYTDKDGYGIRHFPALEELVDLPDPLSQAERTIISLWKSVLFNEEILMGFPNEQAVVLERRGEMLMAVFTSPNQEYAQHWCSLQPRGRDLQVLAASKVKENLSQQKKKASSTVGSSTTGSRRPYGRPGTTADIRRYGHSQALTQAEKMTQTIGMSGTPASASNSTGQTTTSETGYSAVGTAGTANNISEVFFVELENPNIAVTVGDYDDCEIDVFSSKNGNSIELWDMLDGVSMSSFDDGVFVTWAVQHSMHELVKAIDQIVPRKTSHFVKTYDDLLEALSETVTDHVGGPTEAAPELLESYTVDKVGADELIKRSVNFVISVADVPERGEASMSEAIAAQLVIMYAFKSLLEIASRTEVLPTSTIDAIDADVHKVINELMNLYKKEESERPVTPTT